MYFKYLCLFWINSVNIDAKEIFPPPLDSSRRVESNGINFVEIRSLEAELFMKMLHYTKSNFDNFDNFDTLKLF